MSPTSPIKQSENPFLHKLRQQWFLLTLPFTALTVTGLAFTQPVGMSLLLWCSLISLFLHQFEEWCYPGYFPGMLNSRVFKSDTPNRYPLNANSGMIVNVALGWGSYLLAALFWQQAMWLAIATILVSVGNIFAHTIVFNVKGKTRYNPGLLTSWLCFAPVVYLFFFLCTTNDLASPTDWYIGIALGIVLNYFGVYRMIFWLADKNSPYTLAPRLMVPSSN